MVKKIIFDHTIFLHQKTGGVSNYIYELNKNLNKYKIDSKILAPISINNRLLTKNKNVINFIKLKSIPFFCTRIFYFVNDIITLFYIYFNKPNLIHLSYYNNFLVKFLKIPYILTVYDLIHEKLKIDQKRFNKTNLIENAQRIICISNKTRKDLIKFYGVKKNKIKVIYLGADKTYINNKKKKNFILFVGSRLGYKNFNKFIYAFSKSKFLKKNYKVCCFSQNQLSINEKKLFKSLNIQKNVFFLSGDDKKLNKIYSKASLLVYPTLHEGFGLPPLEAMRSGCPVASSNIDPLKEIYGNSVIFFNPLKVLDIKKKIEKILKSKSLQKKLIKKGFEKSHKFLWSKCTNETLKVYNSII